MRRAAAGRGGVHLLAFAAAGGLACFGGESLLGQPCQSDDDCNAVASLRGYVPCRDHVCGVVCGDDVVQVGHEQCEDGNDDNTDDCVDCRWATCGDQATQAGVEECDDGNDDDTDACAGCMNAHCGDGFVWAGHEACDDGDDDRTDGCVDCQRVACGDGEVDPETEACDDGEDLDEDDGCNTACRMGAERLASALDAYHTCVVRRGALRCWGDNSEGQLGLGHTSAVGNELSDLPLTDVLGGHVLDVSVGRTSTCVLLDTPGDNAYCWGRIDERLGVPLSMYAGESFVGDEPGEVPGIAMQAGGTVVQLTDGESPPCALLAGGVVRCWSLSTDDAHPKDDPPAALPGPAKYIAGGHYQNVCAVLESGELWCGVSGTPYKVFEQLRVEEVAMGWAHTCVRLVAGDVMCWGENLSGQLGYPELDLEEVLGDPLAGGPVALGAAAVDIAVGAGHTCALLVGGAVRCWGYNAGGQCGQPGVETVRDPMAFAPVLVGGPARTITAGLGHTCALLHGGEVRCWGDNYGGSLGVGHTDVVGDDPWDLPPAPAILYVDP